MFSNGSLKSAGNLGYYWLGTADVSPLYSYFLLFDGANLYPSRYRDRWSGLAGRQLLKRLSNRLFCPK